MGKAPKILSLISLGLLLLSALLLLTLAPRHALGLIIVLGVPVMLFQLIAFVCNIIILGKGTTGWKIFAAIYGLINLAAIILFIYGLIELIDASNQTYN